MSLWPILSVFHGRASPLTPPIDGSRRRNAPRAPEATPPQSLRIGTGTSSGTSALLGTLLVAVLASCSKDEKVVAAPPPPEVNIATFLQRDVPVYVEAIGKTRGNT